MGRVCLLAGLVFVSMAGACWSVDLEAGPVFTGYNDVRIPGDTGTLFSLKDDLGARVGLGLRGRVSKTFGDRHRVSVLVAPLRVKYRGRLDRRVVFENREFSNLDAIDALYRFDSYRLTYRYGLVRAEQFRFDLGLTAKVRSAEINLQYATVRVPGAKKTNVGFVPLVSFRVDWRFGPWVGLVLDGDALAAPQGRAEDVLAALEIDIGDKVDARIGYRMLEGGSDVQEVYGFAMLHYAVAGVTIWL